MCDFRHPLYEVEEICALLGYYRAYSGNSSLMFTDDISVPSSKANKSTKKSVCRFWWWLAIRYDGGIVGNGVFWSLQHRSKESNVRNFALLI
jgi:hypothetical protein